MQCRTRVGRNRGVNKKKKWRESKKSVLQNGRKKGKNITAGVLEKDVKRDKWKHQIELNT